MKHAQAKHVEIRLWWENGRCLLTIKDNGIGFDNTTSTHRSGYGLQNMKERIQKINGILTIETMPGKGTKIKMEV